MTNRDSRRDDSFDRSTVAGRQAEMEHLDGLSDTERDTFDPGHRYVTANPSTTPDREARLAQQLADISATGVDA